MFDALHQGEIEICAYAIPALAAFVGFIFLVYRPRPSVHNMLLSGVVRGRPGQLAA